MAMKPYILFAPVGHPDYDTPLARREHTAAKELLRSSGVQCSSLPILTSHRNIRQSLHELPFSNLAGAIIFLTSWIEPPVAMELILSLPKDTPLLIWSFPMQYIDEKIKDSTGSLVAQLTLRGTLQRAGIRFCELIASANSSESLCRQKLTDFLQAVTAGQALRKSRIGLVGYTSMGMYTGTFDHLRLRTKIGPEVIHIDSWDVIREADKIPDQISDKELRRHFDDFEAALPAEKKASAVYRALKKLCAEHDLDAVNVKCQYEFSKHYEMTACVPLAALAEDGIVCGCEGDMLCTVSMLILHLISGRQVTYADIIDIENDALLFSACGYLPPSLGEAPLRVREFPAGFGFSGLSCHYVMKPGRITAFRTSETDDGYSFLLAAGDGVETPLRQGAFPALKVKFFGNIAGKLLDTVPSQHMALVPGDYSEPLRILASFLNCPIDTLNFKL